MKNYYQISQSRLDTYVIVTKLDLPEDKEGFYSTCFEGRKISVPVPNPFEFEIDRLNGGNPRHYIQGVGVVIISELLLKTFRNAGINNFQVFPAILRDKQSKKTWNNYYIFNELGLMDAALLEECEYNVIAEKTDNDSGVFIFDKVVLSAKKLKKEPKMFRLAEDTVSQFYISSDVRDILNANSPPEKWGILFSETEVK
jgi:hypothetical protein